MGPVILTFVLYMRDAEYRHPVELGASCVCSITR
jgi:hypothetical protein